MRLGSNHPASGSTSARTRHSWAFPRAAAALVGLFGLLVLGGWLFGVARLRAPAAGLAEVKANAALAFVLAGISLWLLAPGQARGRRRSLAWACAAGAGLIGAASLVEYLAGMSLGIDELLVEDDGSAAHEGRPALGSALNFALLGLVLLILDVRSAFCRALVQALAVAAVASSLLAILAAAYAVGGPSSATESGLVPPHAAVAFLLLASGLLAVRPDLGLVGLVRGRTSGSVMARRLLPVALVLLPLLGALRLQGEAAGLYGTYVGVAIHSISALLILVGMVLWTARALNRTDRERRERALHTARLAAIVESSHDAIISKDPEGVITSWNAAAERMYGHTEEEAVGRSIELIIPGERRDEMYAILSSVLAGDRLEEHCTERVTKDGRTISVSLSVSPIRDLEGQIVGASVVARDITERRRAEEAVAESNRRFNELAHNIQEVFWITSADMSEAIYVSPSSERVFGLTSETLREDPGSWMDLVDPDDRDHVRESFGQLASTGSCELEYRIVRPDGAVRWIQTRGALVRDADGNPYQAVGSSDDVTERKLAAKEAAEARAEAERANQAKSEFLSRMSHELRTPLNAVLGFAQLLELDELEEEQSESVRQILKGGRHLLSLIDEVLDISRIESGRLSVSVEPVHTEGLLDDVLALVKPTAAERGVQVTREDRGGGDRRVAADLQRLKQVLLNLLSNAIKYNRDGGCVTVWHEEVAGDRLRILVSDTGLGIPADKLERLFSPFDRLGAERTEVQGTGLGLALSKRLTEAMGGTLTAESERGRGSTFCVELALATPDEGVEPEPSATLLDAPSTNGSGSGSRRSLLYIEDNPANFELVERLFARDSEVEVSLAMQGGLGLELARQHRPDLVLLDLHLPDLPGWDVLTRLKGDPRTADVPVIVLSADASPRQAERLCEAGACAYVTKPLEVERFFATVRECLDGAEAVSSS